MLTRTATTLLPTTKHEAFTYLSNIENLPAWATEFCKELKVINGEHKVVTCDLEAPELYFKVGADPDTGVIDMLAGPQPDHLWRFPTRIVELPGGNCID